MAELDSYRAKRDPAKTPEPVPSASTRRSPASRRRHGGSPKPTFVIQEHHASRLHWDFRLERDGVLASWAIPKGLPPDKGINHLAVHVEDHPLEYGSFEGTIPKGEYGGGVVTIWDRGWYECDKWTDKDVKVTLHGQRVDGRYALFRTRDDDWMIHKMDPAPDGWQPLPPLIKPMLATAAEQLPAGATGSPAWCYEMKWDGIRALAYCDGGRVRLLGRNGTDITATYPEVAVLGEAMGSLQAVFDGEVVSPDPEGRPSFSAVQQRMHVANAAKARKLAAQIPVVYMVFDLLHLDGHSLLDVPYAERRRLLEDLPLDSSHLAVPPSLTDPPAVALEASRRAGLEGVVAKRADSGYLPGRRSPDWIKVKNARMQEVVIGGWTTGNGSRGGSLGALLLGVPGPEGLHYAGKVGTGFNESMLADLRRRTSALGRATSPFATSGPGAQQRGVTWVEPVLVGEVRFTEWTPDGRLRHPTWRGLRDDKDRADVGSRAEDPADVGSRAEDRADPADPADPAGVESSSGPPAPSSSPGRAEQKALVEVGGHRLTLSNLDKVLYPGPGTTKAEVIWYYTHIAPALLPHLADRPVTFTRYPDGVDGKSFFEKHVPRAAPRWIDTITVPRRAKGPGEPIEYVALNSEAALVWAANLAALELHVPLWRSAGDGAYGPFDLMVFDLDPGLPATIVDCCVVAGWIEQRLRDSGRTPFAKTSGSKGLQVYVRVDPPRRWDEVHTEAREIAVALEREHRDLVVSRMRKDLRPGKVLIDWSQNHPAKTTVAVYSLRARPTPTVSTPVTWDEVRACATTQNPLLLTFEMTEVLERVASMGDLFAPLLD